MFSLWRSFTWKFQDDSIEDVVLRFSRTVVQTIWNLFFSPTCRRRCCNKTQRTRSEMHAWVLATLLPHSPPPPLLAPPPVAVVDAPTRNFEFEFNFSARWIFRRGFFRDWWQLASPDRNRRGSELFTKTTRSLAFECFIIQLRFQLRQSSAARRQHRSSKL